MRRWIERGVAVLGSASLLTGLVFAHIDLELVHRAAGGRLVWNLRVLVPLGIGAALLLALAATRLGDVRERLRGGRAAAFGRNLVGSLAAIAIAVLLNLIAARHPVRLDLTAHASYTISPRTRKALERLAALPGPVTAYVFVRPDHPWLPTLQGLLESYAAAAPHRFVVQRLQPSRDLLRFERICRALGIDPTTLRSANVVILAAPPRTRGALPRSRQVPLEAMTSQPAALGSAPRRGSFRGEEAITRALLSITRARQPRVVLLRGHRELDRTAADPRARIERACRSLESLDYAVTTLRLDPSHPDPSRLPTDGDVLWIAGARDPLTGPERAAIAGWLERGGRLLVLAEPVLRQQPGTTRARFVPLGLDALLRPWGVGLLEAVLADPDTVTPLGPLSLRVPVRREPHMHPIVAPLAGLELWLDRARPLALSPAVARERGLRLTPLLGTYPSARALEDPTALLEPLSAQAPTGAWIVAASVERAGATGAEPATATARVLASGRTRIVVAGDASWCTDALLAREPAHAELLINAVGWLSERDEVVSIAPRPARLLRLHIDRAAKLRLWLLALLDLPGAFVATGLLVWWARRR